MKHILGLPCEVNPERQNVSSHIKVMLRRINAKKLVALTDWKQPCIKNNLVALTYASLRWCIKHDSIRQRSSWSHPSTQASCELDKSCRWAEWWQPQHHHIHHIKARACGEAKRAIEVIEGEKHEGQDMRGKTLKGLHYSLAHCAEVYMMIVKSASFAKLF